MVGELDVLRIVSERLAAAGIHYMLTGSYAMAFYATPRMTRDLDLVVELRQDDVVKITQAFSNEFYVDADDVRTAIASQRMFNLMHLASGIKVDLIVCKQGEYRQVEFARRRQVTMAGVSTWIVTAEDLILSKLLWAMDSGSELQMRDVRSLLGEGVDPDNDTSEKIAALVEERHRRMTTDERVIIAARMFDTARAIVESSLPADLSPRDRRLSLVRRLYGDEISEAAKVAFADWPVDHFSNR